MAALRTKRFMAVAGMTIGVLGGAGVAMAAGGSARSSGPDYAYGVDNPFVDASATVHVVRTAEGSANITLHVHGANAPAGRRFGAHVHQNPCGALPTAAGGHYQHADATGSLEEREVWLDVTVNEAGNGHAMANRPWAVDESHPRSVIIHALPTAADGTAGARLACIDLDGQP